jgi:hypothetical protein
LADRRGRFVVTYNQLRNIPTPENQMGRKNITPLRAAAAALKILGLAAAGSFARPAPHQTAAALADAIS